MTYQRRIIAQIHRLGRKAEVKTRSTTGQNEFGNPTDAYTSDRYVTAFKTYPNRNTQIESNVGDRGQDRPVFLVPNTSDQPAPPAEEDVLVYDGQHYEVKSHTTYDTHVEFFGEPLIHDDGQ